MNTETQSNVKDRGCALSSWCQKFFEQKTYFKKKISICGLEVNVARAARQINLCLENSCAKN